MSETPTFYANFVTTNMNVDEAVIEFRRVIVPHRDNFQQAGASLTIPIPPVSREEIAKTDPIARVVLTFSAAKGLYEFLNAVLPTFEEARKTGVLRKS